MEGDFRLDRFAVNSHIEAAVFHRFGTGLIRRAGRCLPPGFYSQVDQATCNLMLVENFR